MNFIYSEFEKFCSSCCNSLKQHLIFEGRKLTATKLYNDVLYKFKTKTTYDSQNPEKHFTFIPEALIQLLPEFRMISWYPSFRSIVRIPCPASYDQRMSMASRWLLRGTCDVFFTRNAESLSNMVSDVAEKKHKKISAALAYKVSAYYEGEDNIYNLKYLKPRRFFFKV